MMFWPDGGMSGWGWAGMTVGMVLFWGLIILGLVLLVRGLSRPSEGSPAAGGSPAVRRPTPEELLAERFARGEIEEDEYRSRLAALSSAGGVTAGR